MMAERSVSISALDRAGALQALNDVQITDNDSSICLDFGSMGRVEPLGMMYFAASLKSYREQLKSSRPDVTFRAVGYEGHDYPAHMGFFRMFGLKFGKNPDDASGGSRYEPIRFLDLREIEQSAADKYQDVHDAIEERSQGLAKLLVQGNQPELVETLGYSLREIIRNSLEHARVGGLWYCAQYWPARDLVELALLDQGVGIRSSLARNPHLDLASDEDALRQALRPGISGVAFKGAKKRRDDAWQNSGFGLYMTSRLAGRDGEFFIGSGSAGLALSRGKESVAPFKLQGTGISIRFRPSKVAGLRASLDELRKSASDHEVADMDSAVKTASMSSIMLSRDFDKEG